MERRRYTSVIFNVLDVQCALPVEIIPGHFLARADDAMIDHIESFAKIYGDAPIAPSPTFRFKNRCVATSQVASTTSWSYEALPRPEWRYYVVEHDAENHDVKSIPDSIEKVSRLTDLEFHFWLMLLQDGSGSGGTLPDTDGPIPSELDRLDEEVARQINNLYREFKIAEQQFPDIARSIALHYDLRRVGIFSPLYDLGLFAIIESVLTHDQRASHDSLTHQLKTKFELLQPRMNPPIDYGIFRATAKKSKSTIAQVWEELYSWRSAIAHGDEYPPSTQVIPDLGAARRWLRQTTKSLLRRALHEPQLFHDLKRV